MPAVSTKTPLFPSFSPLVCVLVLACAALNFAAWWPGMMSYDSVSVWRMTETWQLTNAHPVFYLLIVGGLRQIADTPASVLAFNIAVYSIGSLFLAEVLRQRSPRLALLVPFTLLLPFITNFIGLLWKDTAMAASWWGAASIGLYCAGPGQLLHPRTRRLLMGCACVLFAVGLLIRHNALAAAPFLLLALMLAMRPAPRSWVKRLAMLCVAGLLSLGTLVASNALIDQVYEVKKIDMINDLFLYDLAGISKQTGQNAFGVEFTPEEFGRAMQCYRLTDWNTYANPDHCLFVMDRLVDRGMYEDGKLGQQWLEAVQEHPLAYAQHRLNVFASLLRIGKRGSYGGRYAGIDPNEFGLSHPEHALYRGFQRYVKVVERRFVMKPWFWLAANVVVLVILLRRRKGPEDACVALVAASGLVYLLCYLPFGIASDFRYAYWTVMATMWAWLFVLSTHEKKARQQIGHGQRGSHDSQRAETGIKPRHTDP